MGTGREDKKQFFVGVTGVLVMILFLIKNKIFILCRLFFREAYWLQFWALLQHEDKREMFHVQAKCLRLSLHLVLPRMDGKVIIDFAYDFLLFVYILFIYLKANKLATLYDLAVCGRTTREQTFRRCAK